VFLTFLSDSNLRAMLQVRITRICAGQFCGRLATPTARSEWFSLRPNALVTFSAEQIHSIARPQPWSARGKNLRGC
jgi:hypothetical protein